MPSKLSHDEIRDLLRVSLNADTPAGKVAYIRSVYPDTVVYDLESANLDSSGGPVETLRRSYVIDGKTATVALGDPEKVREVRSYEPVAPASFSMEAGSEEGDTVTWTGKVFEVGSWPDKRFSLTDNEAEAAVQGFQPVPADVEHAPSIFDGKLGTLAAIEKRGKDLIGTMKIPRWLHQLVKDDPLKVSLAWDRNTKRIGGIGLVLNPRISDAQLSAAFSAANDTTPDPAPAGPSDSRKGNPIMKSDLLKRFLAMFSQVSEDDLKAALEDATDDKPADGKPAEKPADPPADDSKNDAQGGDPPADKTVGDPSTDDKDAEIARLKAELAQKDQAAVANTASAFAQAAIDAGKALPAEKDALAALFSQAVTDDNAGQACFTADGSLIEGTRVASLRAAIDARPVLGLTKEQLPSNASAVFGTAPAGQVDQAQIDALLSLTPMGQRVLNARKGSK